MNGFGNLFIEVSPNPSFEIKPIKKRTLQTVLYVTSGFDFAYGRQRIM